MKIRKPGGPGGFEELKTEFIRLLGGSEKAAGHACLRDYSIEYTEKATTLRLECGDCKQASSPADPVCRKRIIEKLSENPIDKIEFRRPLKTEEYQGEDIRHLKEISELLIKVEGMQFGSFREECGKCAQRVQELRGILIDSLKTDPLRAYRGLDAPIGKDVTHTRPECRKCATKRVKTFSYVKGALENTSLIKKSERYDKEEPEKAYERIFVPHLRPSISESLIMRRPPEDATPLCDEYLVEGARVRLYRMHDVNEDLYFIVPPEYELIDRPDVLQVLSETKDWLLRNAGERIEHTRNLEATRKKFASLSKIKILEYAAKNNVFLESSDVEMLSALLLRCTCGLDVIELLLKDPNVNDVYVNAPMENTPVYVKHRDFDDCKTNVYLSSESGSNFVLKFVLKSGIGISPNSPILDMDLEDLKTRVSVIAPPLSPDGMAFSLRCKNEVPWSLPMLMEKRALSPLAAAMLSLMVNDQVALLIVGGRGTGKTSFLGALMSAMNPKNRILTIEDTLELPVPELNAAGFRMQRMLSRPVTTTEGLNISADDALRSSLRMGESSIVVGEVRGQEAKVLYESIRVGATGNTVLGTIHGRSPRDVFERVVYDLEIPATSFKATDVVVVTQRLPVGRRVTEIAQLNKNVDIDQIGSGKEADKLFDVLMRYDHETDELMLPKRFKPRDSQVISRIAERRGTSPEKVWEDVSCRAKMYSDVLSWSGENGSKRMIEVAPSVDYNKKYAALVDEQRCGDGGRYRRVDYDRVYEKWREWSCGYRKTLGTGA